MKSYSDFSTWVEFFEKHWPVLAKKNVTDFMFHKYQGLSRTAEGIRLIN